MAVALRDPEQAEHVHVAHVEEAEYRHLSRDYEDEAYAGGGQAQAYHDGFADAVAQVAVYVLAEGVT